jgi:hypothetical protein
MYFYIQDNKDWNHDKKVKYGITSDYKERLKTDQHSYPSEYINLYEYNDEKCKLNYKEADNIIKNIKKDDFKKVIIQEYPLVNFEYLFKNVFYNKMVYFKISITIIIYTFFDLIMRSFVLDNFLYYVHFQK